MNPITKEKLRENLMLLEFEQQMAIHLRFWEHFTIAQIARVLGLTWDEADRLIETTLSELKTKLTNINLAALCAA